MDSCALYDVGAQDGTSFLVMQHLEGETLRALLDQGALPMPRITDVALQLLSGLAAAHAHGIVHRDPRWIHALTTFGLTRATGTCCGG